MELHCDRGYGEVASQRLMPLSAPLAPARLALMGRLQRCVAPLPAAWLSIEKSFFTKRTQLKNAQLFRNE